MGQDTEQLRDVRNYYENVLQDKTDLKTTACCDAQSPPEHVREVLEQLGPEVLERYYGCGSPIPPALEGCTVLDLGCGTGRDAFVASRLVGQEGRVIGVDMSEKQLEVGRRHLDAHMERFGYDKPNMSLEQGYIEDLRAVDIEDESVDVVVSNCVINLSPDKEAVFREIFRVLRPGGELYFADIFADRRVPRHLREDPVLRGECLGGAPYVEDFRRLLAGLGYPDYRTVSMRRVDLQNEELEARVGDIDFYSMTVRAFKVPGLEDRCEDYGQQAVYEGGIPECSSQFRLDRDHIFEVGQTVPVCGNTAAMLQNSRYGSYFTVEGEASTHRGLFGGDGNCGALEPRPGESGGSGCCG